MKLPRLFHEPSRYLVVGAACAVVTNAILIGGDAAGLNYMVLNVIAFVLVLPASYLAHAWWTFEVRASWSAFCRFIGATISSLLVATIALWAFRGAMGLPMFIAAPAVTVAMTLYNFVVAKWAMLQSPNGRSIFQS